MMRAPSRNMPPACEPPTVSNLVCICLGAIFFTILASPGLIWWPLAFFFPVLFAAVTAIDSWRGKRIAEARRDYSICQFARSFDCRIIDTWIIRAAFEEFSYSYPVKPDDSIADDLGIVDEDLDDSLETIARRAGRCIDNTETNPMYDKVETVGDLIMFLQYQPRLAMRETGTG